MQSNENANYVGTDFYLCSFWNSYHSVSVAFLLKLFFEYIRTLPIMFELNAMSDLDSKNKFHIVR